MTTHPCSGRWRERATERAAEGNVPAAQIYRRCAEELDQYETQQQLEAITLSQASSESGYSKAHLTRLVANGDLANVGKKGAPRVMRRDLPRKPNRSRRDATS